MVFLDSDLMIGVLRKDAAAIRALSDIENRGGPLRTTVINAVELVEGAVMSRKEGAVHTVDSFLATLEMLHLDSLAASLAGQIIGNLKLRGEQIDNMDALIGSITIAHNETLVTRNVKHFGRIKGLKVETW
ncbi:MAG: type II toxin-antitoxin system VapC family toxin [Candidatus Aenigmatarchaeota archaeon]|nr:MAG: type II toxin-antitoxin system VapC family toxin [Candidatus Aenigmarchaeota archaeon]